MNIINRLWAVLLLGITLTISSCEFTNLDLQENPNAPSPEQAELEFLFNRIQLDFKDFVFNANSITDDYARQGHMAAFTYANAAAPTRGNFLWNEAYAVLFPDIDALIAIAEGAGADIEKGASKIMKAYILFTLVDVFGDVPYSQAGQGTDIISPVSDDAAGLYTTAIGILDEAIADLTGTNAGAPATDNYYGGDATKWVTLAKTLKLRAYANIYSVDGGAAAAINAIVAEGDIIDTPGEDFQFQYGNQRLNPNSRHPWYNNAYEQTDAAYLPNYFMWLLVTEKGMVDPRTRFYFYRQVPNSLNADPNAYSCQYNEGPPDANFYPQHYVDIDPETPLPYCVAADNGYYGRDHGNGSGIPPDGPIRAVYGLYPAAGRFDDNSYDFTQNAGVDGAEGQGILPIWTSAYTHFALAEAALMGGADGSAIDLMETGIRQSIAKARSFESFLDPGQQIGVTPTGEPILLSALLDPLDDDTEDYVDLVRLNYESAGGDDGRLDVLIKEYLIATWGSGIEAYNMYRRTGKPDNIQPTLDPSSGNFIHSLLYPSDHVNNNANVSQKSTDEQPFWTNVPASVFDNR